MRQTRWVGVDIGSACVKVVALQRRAGKLEVTGVAAAELPPLAPQSWGERGADGPVAPPDAEALARAVRSALDSAGARAGDVAVGIPQHRVSLRVLRLPGAPSNHLARAALLEGTRDLPFPPGELTAGVHVQAGRDEEESVALVAAARADLLDAYRKGLGAAGVRAGWLGVSSLAAVAAADLTPQPKTIDHRPQTVDPDGETGRRGEGETGSTAGSQAGGRGTSRPWVLVDIGAASTTICYCAEGTVQASRSVLIGGTHLTQALAVDLGCVEEAAEERKRSRGLETVDHGGTDGEASGVAVGEWVEQIAAEIRLLLSAVAVQGLPPAAGMRLAGGGSLASGLAPRLSELLELPAEAVEVPALAALARPDAAQFAGAYGMALLAAGEARTADLLAEEVARAQVHQRRRRNAWLGAAVALVVLAGGGAAAHQQWRTHQGVQRERSAAAHQASAERSRVKKLDARRQELAAQAQSLRRALRPEPAWVEVVDALALAAPSGVWVTGIELERGKPLVVRGTALEATAAARFVTTLMESPLLAKVQLSFANGAQVGGRRVTHFGISALVRGNTPERRVTVKASTARKRPASASKRAVKGEEE